MTETRNFATDYKIDTHRDVHHAKFGVTNTKEMNSESTNFVHDKNTRKSAAHFTNTNTDVQNEKLSITTTEEAKNRQGNEERDKEDVTKTNKKPVCC